MSLLELIDNIFQLLATFSVGIIACIYSINRPNDLPLQYLAGASLFLIRICFLLFKQHNSHRITRTQLLLTILFPFWVFIINMICYLMVGGLFSTLYYCVPLIFLAYISCRNLFILKDKLLSRFNLSIFILVIINNMMFLVSSLGWNTLYVLFDILLTFTFLFMLYFLKKENNYD